ncbi:MAG TPA: CBS domain-containing protein [Trueperaceae bacterium]|nr:CBS domain-containing protein [Trueperaceae bacterium]
MRLIVTHEQPDFDALASLALARLLFPNATATIQGSLSPGLTAFLRLYRDQLELADPQTIDLAAVTELVVVDTADAGRIRPFDSLVGRVPVTLYDHHPPPERPIPAARGLREPMGSTATLLTRELMATGIDIPPPIASLALLGIHEDTGNLSYDLTRPDDYRAAAHLLASGASLQLVRRFTVDAVSPEHHAFREAMLDAARPLSVAGRRVSVAAFDYPSYVPGVSGLANDLLELHQADAAVVAAGMEGKTLVFARASERFDVAAALHEALGGAGHPGAAFAKTELAPAEAAERVLAALARHATPVLTAAALMSAPVKTVRESASVAEAQQQLLLFGHNGMPVLDGDGRLVGVVSRRDLERALRHGLGRSRVSGFMSRNAITAGPTSVLADLEELVLRHNIGRIPILEGDRLVGIVTRTDLIGARHRRPGSEDPARSVLGRLPPSAQAALESAADVAGDASLYLVGGTVRDALLGAGFKDLDISVEGGTAERLGSRLQARLGGTLSCHVPFGTCTLSLEDGLVVDLATAREEVYDHPGALPSVTPSTVRKDLSRRDFTVNAIALRFHPGPPELIDPYGGADDLRARQLRVLHPLSFVEDPTRVLRGARLAGRLGFHFEPTTAERAHDAMAPVIVGNVSGGRLRGELELTLAEPRVAPALARLDEVGGLKALFGLQADFALLEALDEQRHERGVPDEAYLLALLLSADEATAARHLEAFHWPRRYAQVRLKLRSLLAEEHVPDEALEGLDEAARVLLRCLSPELAARLTRLEEGPPRRRLRGRDVLDLGLAPGPAVGRVLDEVARARAEQRVRTFEDEVEMARRLVHELQPQPGGRELP